MTGIEPAVVAKAAGPAVGKLVGAATKPLVDGVKRNLARRGYGKTDIYTALESIEKELPYIPSTLGLVLALPPNLNQRQVNAIAESDELVALAQLMISIQFTPARELLENKVRKAVHGVFLSRHPDSAGRALDQYVKEFCDLMKERSKEIYQQLLNRLETKTDSLLWASANITIEHLRSIDQYLAVLSAGQSLDPSAVLEWRDAYLAAFRARHSGIEVPDLAHRRTVEYEKLFVGAQLSATAESSRNLVRILGEDSLSDGSTLTDQQFLDLINRTVVLGDPGAGKSTTSTLLALRSWDVLGLIPLVIVMKHITFRSGGFSLIDEAESRFRSYYQCPAPKGLVQKLLLEGKLFIVFDGLDELLDGRTRRSAVGVVETISKLYPFVRILVTSRSVGYAVARLDYRFFDEFQLAPFVEPQVRQYVTKWLRLQQSELSEVALNELVEDLMNSSESLVDVRQNPLLLAFICVLYAGHRHIPRRRPELYRKCIELLLTEWDRARDITSTVAEIEVYEVALTRLAYLILTDPSYRDGITERDVYELIVPALIEESVPDERTSREVVRDLLDLCRGRAWIFTDVGLNDNGEDIFSFTHTSFMEYFAARYIDRSCETPEAMADRLMPEIGAGRWEILAQICLALRDRHAVAGASRAVARMLKHVQVLLRNRIAGRRTYAMEWSGADHPSASPEETFEDVAIVEFLLRASDTLAMSSEVLGATIEVALDQMAEGRSRTLSVVLDERYRYSSVAADKLVSSLSGAFEELIQAPESWYDPVVPAKAWLGTHFAYYLDYPANISLSKACVEDVCSRIEICDGNWLGLASKSTLAWNIGVQLGRNDVVVGSFDAPTMVDSVGVFQRIFEPCGSPIREFGPFSTVSWLIDCVISPKRRMLHPGNAFRLLRAIGNTFAADYFEAPIPLGVTEWAAGNLPLRKVSNLLAGHKEDVFLGWLVLVMGTLELGSGLTGTRERALLSRGRRAELSRRDMDSIFELYVSRGLSKADLVSNWLCGDISLWSVEDMGVS